MASEYICKDCGCLLTHSNELTLQSMKEIHSQLCIIKRQKLIAAQSIQEISSMTSTTQSTVQVPLGSSNIPSSEPSNNKIITGETSISLTGSGTGHSKVDGPIDTSFKSKRQKAGKFKGISVWGPMDPPG
ncbi:MAG TPA: hypothetical protein VEW92_14215, partial [Nitrososphaeraceae archaeon]|nr:hypothetical protein [Nitrososphaeraceae archaeon]